jgi:hypothetical protein
MLLRSPFFSTSSTRVDSAAIFNHGGSTLGWHFPCSICIFERGVIGRHMSMVFHWRFGGRRCLHFPLNQRVVAGLMSTDVYASAALPRWCPAYLGDAVDIGHTVFFYLHIPTQLARWYMAIWSRDQDSNAWFVKSYIVFSMFSVPLCWVGADSAACSFVCCESFGRCHTHQVSKPSSAFSFLRLN